MFQNGKFKKGDMKNNRELITFGNLKFITQNLK